MPLAFAPLIQVRYLNFPFLQISLRQTPLAVKVPYFIVHKQNSDPGTVDQYWRRPGDGDEVRNIERIIFAKSVCVLSRLSIVDVYFLCSLLTFVWFPPSAKARLCGPFCVVFDVRFLDLTISLHDNLQFTGVNFGCDLGSFLSGVVIDIWWTTCCFQEKPARKKTFAKSLEISKLWVVSFDLTNFFLKSATFYWS